MFPRFLFLSILICTDAFVPNFNVVLRGNKDICVSRRHGCVKMMCQVAEKHAVSIEHQNVPQEHEGLHSALYGDGDDHGASEQVVAAEVEFKDETLPLEKVLSMSKNIKLAALFSVADANGIVKFIAFTRNLHLSVSALRASTSVGRDCCTLRVKSYKFPSREEMAQQKSDWLQQLAYVPEGNREGVADWERAMAETAVVLQAAEAAAHEEKKRKLRKAMADPTLHTAQEQDRDPESRRADLKSAIEDDDWSGEINRQTAATIAPAAAPAAPAAVVSPFQSSEAAAAGGGGGMLDFNLANVDLVLDEVRPYMMADGGNCKVAGVDVASGEVRLILEGACGSCPSSTVTLKMGVERVLREKFGERFGQVVQVDAAAAAGGAKVLTREVVEALLQPVQPAILGLGGSIKVRDVDAASGGVTLQYTGPAKLTFGLEMTLKENPLVRTVTFL